MISKPSLICMDLEGVLVPEIWLAVAKQTGIEQLRFTTRDIPDYDELMRTRLALLAQHHLTITHIQNVIKNLEPLSGAKDFLDWLRSQTQLIILSDTYYEFAYPLMNKLGNPTLFCNSLIINEKGQITGYRLRKQDGKKRAVCMLQQLGFRILAVGDAYNDIAMLKSADCGILFRPPDAIVDQFPQFEVIKEFKNLKTSIHTFLSASTL